MKKISLLCAIALAGLSLTACGSNSSKKASSSSKASSSKVVKHHKKAKRSKKVNKSKHASSSSAVSASSQQNQQQQAQASNGQQQASQNNGQLPPASDIHDFVNRYGVSPALWKMQHGMNAKDALMSTPEDMRTSGENQDVTDRKSVV